MWWWSALRLAAESVFKTYCTETITIATNESQYREEHIKDRNGPNYAKLSQLKLLKHSWDYTLYFSLSLSLSQLCPFFIFMVSLYSQEERLCVIAAKHPNTRSPLIHRSLLLFLLLLHPLILSLSFGLSWALRSQPCNLGRKTSSLFFQ